MCGEARGVVALVFETRAVAPPPSQLAAWRAGCIAVPLCITHPLPELEYVTTDSGAVLVVADAKNAEIGLQLALRARLPFVNVSEVTETGEWDSDKLPDVDLGDGASILYTSGVCEGDGERARGDASVPVRIPREAVLAAC